MKTRHAVGAAAVAALAIATLPVPGAAAAGTSHAAQPAKHTAHVVLKGLNGAQRTAVGMNGNLLMTQAGAKGGGVLQEYVTHGPRTGKVRTLGTLPGVPSDIAVGPGRSIWVLFGAAGGDGPPPPPGTPNSQLFRWTPGHHGHGRLVKVADLASWAKKHPDPNDLEHNPADSNAYGLAALPGGRVLVADAAANSLLTVTYRGKIRTVVHLPVQKISTAGVPSSQGPLPAKLPAEAVPTSVAVGPDGYWYVGELKGFPFTPGTSRVWRIKPGTQNAQCHARSTGDRCRIYADGFSSIIDLTSSPRTGKLSVLTMSSAGVGAVEGGPSGPPPPPGQLFALSRNGHHRHQIAKGTFIIPGGVTQTWSGTRYVTAMFLVPGMGQLYKVR